MSDARRCTAHNRQGKPCRQPAVAGATVCRYHGGSAPQVRRAAEVRAAKIDAETKAQRMVARAGVDADPIEHLLESLHRAAALVEVWGQMVADLDNAAEVDLQDRPGGLRGEVWYETVEYDVTNRDGDTETKTVRVPKADRLLAFNRDGLVTTHPFVDEYQRALERRAKFAKLAIDAGVAERQVRLAERQGQLMAEAVRAILSDLGVADHPEAPAVVRRHLTAVAG